MSYNIPPAAPWISAIPVALDRAPGPGSPPHVRLDEHLRFDMGCNPTATPPDAFSVQMVYPPVFRDGDNEVMSPEYVAVEAPEDRLFQLDKLGRAAALGFWARNEIPAAFCEDTGPGLAALVDVPQGRHEMGLDDNYRFEVTSQGIVLATMRVLVQRARHAAYY